VSHCGLAIYIEKYLKAKEEELWKHSNIISPCKNIKSSKKSSEKKPKSFKKYYNSIITNLKFQHKPKCHLSKILI
jgi:hypothetical protein